MRLKFLKSLFFEEKLKLKREGPLIVRSVPETAFCTGVFFPLAKIGGKAIWESLGAPQKVSVHT